MSGLPDRHVSFNDIVEEGFGAYGEHHDDDYEFTESEIDDLLEPEDGYRRRPDDQHLWLESDLESLRRDREQAQAVRDLYIVSNPEEFFTDGSDVSDEDRITARNFLPNPGEEAAFWRSGNEEVDDRMSAVEIAEMHRTGNYQLDGPPLLLFSNAQDDDDETEDEDSDDEFGHDHQEDVDDDYGEPEPDLHLHGLGDEIAVDDLDNGHDIEDISIGWDYGRYESPAAALLDQMVEATSRWNLSEEQDRALAERVFNLACYHARHNPHQPRWQRALAYGIEQIMTSNYQNAYRNGRRTAEFVERTDEEWEKLEEARSNLQTLQTHKPILQRRFARSWSALAREDTTLALCLMDYSKLCQRVTKTNTRYFDMLSWYPLAEHEVDIFAKPDWSAAAEVREDIASLCRMHQKEAYLNCCICRLEHTLRQEELPCNLMNEEHWAAKYSDEFRFGYDMGARFNGFADFRVDETLSLEDKFSFIADMAWARRLRLWTAMKRLRIGGAVIQESDNWTFAMLTQWLCGARLWLAEWARRNPPDALPEESRNIVLSMHEMLKFVEAETLETMGVLRQPSGEYIAGPQRFVE